MVKYLCELGGEKLLMLTEHVSEYGCVLGAWLITFQLYMFAAMIDAVCKA